MSRLHVNIDHVATVRQARREAFPDPILWALAAERAGAQGITCHLRKDRRHIQDADVHRLNEAITTTLNFECSLDPEMIEFASELRPAAICLVPENRAEVTTEGGLDVIKERGRLDEVVPRLAERGSLVSLFVDADPDQLEAAAATGAQFVELHTGAYANQTGADRERELKRLMRGAEIAHELGLRVNAGHGLDYDNLAPILPMPHLEELNIGFAIVAHSLFVGVESAVGEMYRLIQGDPEL